MPLLYGDATLDAHPPAYAWLMDEANGNRADAIGGKTLTDHNTVTSDTGKRGLAAKFTAANLEYLDDSAAGFARNKTAVSVSCWMKCATVSGTMSVIRDFLVSHGVQRFTLAVLNTGAVYLAHESQTASSSAGAIAAGSWYHIVAAIDTVGDTLRCWVNAVGKIDSSQAMNAFSDVASIYGMLVGVTRNDAVYAQYFDGLIDELVVWDDYALTAEDAALLYNGGDGLWLANFAGNVSRLSARSTLAGGNPSRLNATPDILSAGNASRLSARAALGAGNVSRLGARGALSAGNVSRLDARAVLGAGNVSRLDIRAALAAAGQASRHHWMAPRGWTLYARNVATGARTRLGTIDGGASPRELAGVVLANGTYEIEVRPSEYFWDEAVCRLVTTLVVSGGAIASQGIPAIRELANEIEKFKMKISWEIATEFTDPDLAFGLWFGAASPVDTSGTPDVSKTVWPGVGRYSYRRASTASEYVAVAARRGSTNGPVSELYLAWDSAAPDSPTHQFAHNT